MSIDTAEHYARGLIEWELRGPGDGEDAAYRLEQRYGRARGHDVDSDLLAEAETLLAKVRARKAK